MLVSAGITNTLHEDREAVLSVSLERDGKICGEGSVKAKLKACGKTNCQLSIGIDSPALWDDITPNLYLSLIHI